MSNCRMYGSSGGEVKKWVQAKKRVSTVRARRMCKDAGHPVKW